jgi:hypothetical protein
MDDIRKKEQHRFNMLIEESVTINAPLERVWDVFTDLTCWSDWSTVITGISTETERITEGSSIKFCIRPFDIPVNLEPVIEEVVPHERIVWQGKKHGIVARHEFTFHAMDGVVTLTSSETFSGFFLSVLKLFFPKKKIRELALLMLNELKNAAETRAGYTGSLFPFEKDPGSHNKE